MVKPMRFLARTFLLTAGIAAGAARHSFECKASGRLGKTIGFEFFGNSMKRPKTDIRSFTVSTRTEDDRWRAMWSISSGHGVTQPIRYGVTPPGFITVIRPQKLVPGRVYAASASDSHGDSSSLTFGFDKDGTMIFPDSYDR